MTALTQLTAAAIAQRAHRLGEHVHLLEVDESRIVQKSPVALVRERHVCVRRANQLVVTKANNNGYQVSPFSKSGMNGRMGGWSLLTAMR